MRICQLTTVHKPFDTRIFHKECRTLANAGHEVIIIVPHERNDLVQGVRIEAVPLPTSRLRRMFVTPYRVLTRALLLRADLYHFHDPELMPAGLILRLLGRRVIYDAHEDSPAQTMSKHYLPLPLRRAISLLLRSLETATKLAVNGIVTATPAISRNFPAHKTVCIQNYPVLAETQGVPATRYEDRPPHVIFTGWVRRPRGIMELLEALPLVAKHFPDVRLVILGGFSPKYLETEARAKAGWAYVDYHPWLSRDEMLLQLARARIGIVTFHPDDNHINAQPNKLFEYMASALPVIASDFPLWRQIVSVHDCGKLVNPLAANEIADAIIALLNDPMAEQLGLRGRLAVEHNYTWEVESAKLLQFYQRFERAAHTQ